MRRYFMILISALLMSMIIGACSSGGSQNTSAEAVDVKRLVQDFSERTVTAKNASISSKELVVTNADSKAVAYPLPEDEFFVSIAPYIEHTHECAIHSLTGCQGELANKEMNVHIEDAEGHTVLEQTMTTYANGFLDLWLPRNQTYRITITYDGKTATSEFSTFEHDNTCITTIRLTDAPSA